jgi:hydroxymethylbilane synthase
LKPLRIGTRGSALALWQANYLREELARRVQVESELVILKTSGDRFAAGPIEQWGVVGVFTKELEDALSTGRIDLAIHSMKDIPTEFSPVCRMAVVFEREDPRDALIARHGEKLEDLPRGARMGTSSLRRAAQLRAFRPDFQIFEMRGNVDTRLRRLDAGECDAVVLARAGLVRLGFADRIAEILPPEIMLPAVGQGALGLELLETAEDLLRFLDQLIDRRTMLAVTAERAFQARMEGGCRVPLGAWARFEGESFVMDACVLSTDGSRAIRRRREIDGSVSLAAAMALGKALGDEIGEAGGAQLLKIARGFATSESSTKASHDLLGRKIVVTRAPEQAVELAQALEERGAKVLRMPMVRFAAPGDPSALDAAIRRVKEFDWLLFTSQVAVRFYATRRRELDAEDLSASVALRESPRIAVVGRATAKGAKQLGLQVDYVAEAESGAGLARELGPSMRGKSVLLPQSSQAGESLAKMLREAGADVTSVEAYATVAPEGASPEILHQIRTGGVDAIVFASPSAFRNFAAFFDKDELGELSRRVAFAAIGPTTRKAMGERGVSVSIAAADPSVESMVEAIVGRFRMTAASARVQ